MVAQAGVEEECERELQKEQEVEQEQAQVEIQLPSVSPAKETDMDVAAVLHVESEWELLTVSGCKVTDSAQVLTAA